VIAGKSLRAGAEIGSLCGRGFCLLVVRWLLRPLTGGDGDPAKIEMDGSTDAFGAFDAGKAAQPTGQFPGGSDGRSSGCRRVEDAVETFLG
jgi:hypothetical protein